MTMGFEGYDVFMSYSRFDWREASEIDSFLRTRGLKLFFDRRNLAPGLPWVRALEQAISTARAAIVLIGPRGFGNTQQYERELALYRQGRDPSFPVVPVLLPGTSADRPFDFLQVLTWVDFSQVTKVSDAPLELERLLSAVSGKAQPGEVAREAICPYRGLDAFREEDSAFFFGRGATGNSETAIGELVGKVREHPFVMVVGRSGSGKSSLVYAGLLPALRRERDRFWTVATLRPGQSPLRALAATFNPRAHDQGAADYQTKITDEAEKLRRGAPELLSHMIKDELDRSEGKPDRLLLFVDQWEELYAQAPAGSDVERSAQHAADVARFIDLLLNAAQTAPVSVVATVRADFYDPLIGHPGIRALLPNRQVTLASMSRPDLESTIVEPARKVGLIFDPPGLVQQILDEVGADEGALPLLQYALKESWTLRKDNAITADSYARSGGVREAIRLTAERTFEALSPDDQHTARQLFLRLVTPGEGQEDTRARATMPSEPTQRRIVNQFAGPRTRLLVTDFDRAGRPTVEVAHEALIRTWPRLREWINANREKLRARSAVLQAQAEWERQGRRADLLLSPGFQLERARALLADPGDITTDDIKDFIELSLDREQIEIKEREADLARDEMRVAQIRSSQQRTEQQQRITRWALSSVVVVVVVAAVVTALLQADKERRLAIQAKTLGLLNVELEDRSRALNHSQATLFGRLATIERSTHDSNAALRFAILGARYDSLSQLPPFEPSLADTELAVVSVQAGWQIPTDSGTRSARFVGNDQILRETKYMVETFTIGRENAPETIQAISGDQTGEIYTFAASPGGTRAFIGSWSWDKYPLRGPKQVFGQGIFNSDTRQGTVSFPSPAAGSTTNDPTTITFAAFSPEGSQLVAILKGGSIQIRDVENARVLSNITPKENPVRLAALAPRGAQLALVANNGVTVLDTTSRKPVAMIPQRPDEEVTTVTFSPDGSQLLIGTTGSLSIWSPTSGTELGALKGNSASVHAATFNHDGSRIAAAYADGMVRIWNSVSREALIELHCGRDVSSIDFSVDGTRLLTVDDGRVRLWDLSSSINVSQVLHLDNQDIFTSAAFSVDGTQIVTGTTSHLAIWKADSGQRISAPLVHEGSVDWVTFSVDGSRIITSSDNETVEILDPANFVQTAVVRGDLANLMPFRPATLKIATEKYPGHSIGKYMTEAEARDEMTTKFKSVAFTRDGSLVATAEASNIEVREISSNTTRFHRETGSRVNSIAFSPDGQRIVVGLQNGVARVFDIDKGTKEISLLGHEAPITSASFDSSGARILTSGEDATARIWDANTGGLIAKLSSPDDEPVGSSESIQFFWKSGDGITAASFSLDGKRVVTTSGSTARIWNVEPATKSNSSLVADFCQRWASEYMTLTREEMRMAGYSDDTPQLNVCTAPPQ